MFYPRLGALSSLLLIGHVLPSLPASSPLPHIPGDLLTSGGNMYFALCVVPEPIYSQYYYGYKILK